MRKVMLLASIGVLVNFLSLLPVSRANAPVTNPEFVYARVRYHLTDDAWRVNEVPWHHDYPYGDEMFPSILKEVTNVNTSRASYKIVDIDSKELFKYPFAYLCEPGFIELTPQDAANLKKYLDRGGFLLIDDFRTATSSRYKGGGPEDDIEHFREELKKVYPDRELERLDLKEPIFHTFFEIETLDMTAPYIFPGQGRVEFLGLRDLQGNLQMILNNNNDISEFWEGLDNGQVSMHSALESFHFGINDVLYAMTH